MPDKRCEACEFWENFEDPDTDYGQCRRYAPIPARVRDAAAPAVVTLWPETAPTDWCGEFSQKRVPLPTVSLN